MDDFRKVVRLGTVPHDEASMSVYAAVEYADGRLSISGVEGPRPNGDAWGACGQIDMHYRTAEQRDAITPAPGWDRDMLDHFFAVWEKWHLNDMQAGSPAQTAVLTAATVDGAEPWRDDPRWSAERGYPDHYAWAKDLLKRENVDPDPAYLHDGEPYRYGSAWLTVPVPEEVLDFLANLPDADRAPAWV